MFALAELEDVVLLVRASVPSTPQYAWPLLKARTGVEVVVKHENHMPKLPPRKARRPFALQR
jgi:threonine dehydratase